MVKRKNGLVHESLALLSESDRRKYGLAVVLQMSTSVMDLLGVLMVGAVGLLGVAAAQQAPIPEQFQTVLDRLGIGDISTARLAIYLAAIGATLLVAKALLNLYINWRVGHFLARCAAAYSARLSREFFSMPLFKVQETPSQRVSHAMGPGVNAATIDVLMNWMIFLTEAALLVVLGAALLLIDPLTTIIVIVYFGLVALLLARGLRDWAHRIGRLQTESETAGMKTVQDGIATYREVTVAGHRDFYINRYSAVRRQGTRASADGQYIMRMPRYVLEIAMVLGAAILVVTLTMTRPTEEAIGALALFLAASARLMPALLRLNSARLAIHNARGRTLLTFELAKVSSTHGRVLEQPSGDDAGLPPSPVGLSVDVSGLTVQYPGSAEPALKDVSFHLPAGRHVALVGPSGAGKSTLADALLGVVIPVAGEVAVGGMAVGKLIADRPGSIAYVPQDVALVSGTVRDNVALGVESEAVDDEQVWFALERASIADFLRESREGLDTVVGERGVRLSGGQRQRLGIARALYSSPGLLVLDEATSALDAETEHAVTQLLGGIGEHVTTVTIAHRLATIRHADVVLYLDNGVVVARGTFDEVRDSVPQFDRQATLLGL